MTLTPKRILVVEDEKDVGDLILHLLQREGFYAERITDGRSALAKLENELPDLVLLDMMLPDIDGLDVLRRLRQVERTRHLPLLVVSARAEDTERVIGLELGADDYLAKPFMPKELLARIRSVLRRATPPLPEPTTCQYGPLMLDRAAHEVRYNGELILVTAREFSLLEQFLSSRGRVLTRAYLLRTIWGYQGQIRTRTIDVHVRLLRKKIPLLQTAIETIRNVGYKLRPET
ncbi:MAG: response regulator transcription factor [Candidatus Zixiibacteriota bacterium]